MQDFSSVYISRACLEPQAHGIHNCMCFFGGYFGINLNAKRTLCDVAYGSISCEVILERSIAWWIDSLIVANC